MEARTVWATEAYTVELMGAASEVAVTALVAAAEQEALVAMPMLEMMTLQVGLLWVGLVVTAQVEEQSRRSTANASHQQPDRPARAACSVAHE